MRRISVALLLVGLYAATAAASPDLPDGKWWKRPRVAAAIGLTSDQTGEIEAIFSKARPNLIDRKADLEKKQGELEDAIEANAERKEIAALIDVVEDARAELQKVRILMMLDIKQVLQAEQWDQLVRMQQNARRQHMERRGRFGGRGSLGRDGSPTPKRRASP